MPKNEPNYELRVIDEKVRGFSFIIFQTVDFKKCFRLATYRSSFPVECSYLLVFLVHTFVGSRDARNFEKGDKTIKSMINLQTTGRNGTMNLLMWPIQ